MNKYKLTSLSLLASVILVGCTESVEVASPVNESDSYISIGTYINANSKSIEKVSFVDGEAIGICACQTYGGYNNTFSDNFMSNQKVVYQDGVWSYTPLKAWPSDDNMKLSFIAFYPYSALGSSETPMRRIISVASGNNWSKTKDYMICTVRDASINDRNGTHINGNTEDASFDASAGPLSLKFKHILSKIRVYANISTEYSSYNVNIVSMDLSSPNTVVTYDLFSDLSGGSWNNYRSPSSYTFIDADNPVAVSTSNTLLAESLMLPQPCNNIHLDLTFSYVLDGEVKQVSKSYYIPGLWETGKIYDYNITIKPDIEIIDVSGTVAQMDDGYTLSTFVPEPVDLGLSILWAPINYGETDTYIGSYVTQSSINSTAKHWGDGWRAPSQAEVQELIDNCEIAEETVNGRKYLKLTGPNGKEILLPTVFWTERGNIYAYVTTTDVKFTTGTSSTTSLLRLVKDK